MALLVQEEGLVTFNIKINGKSIPDHIEVQEIILDMEVNCIASATVTILEKNEIGKIDAPFEQSEGDLFIPGNEIKISLGYDTNREVAFNGVVVAQRLVVNSVGAKLLISCNDKAFNMTKGRFNAIFKEQKESKVFKSILSKYNGIKLDLEETLDEIPSIIQYNTTDWDFIAMRARANNMIITTHQNIVAIKSIDFSKEPVSEINTAQLVIDIDLNLNSEQMISEVDLLTWNSQKQEETQISTPIRDSLAQGNLPTQKLANNITNQKISKKTTAPLTEAQLKVLGKSVESETTLNKIKGKIVVPGTTKIIAGDLVELSGFSARFNGKAFVSRVVHLLTDGEWLTTLYVGAPARFRDALPSICDDFPMGTPSGIEGHQLATVLQTAGDPAGENRVLITLPTLNGVAQQDGLWARLAGPYASKDAGFFFYPEIGDEVLVSFINNDPRVPIIVGALYNDKNTPKETPEERNRFKSITSRSGIQIRFDEEEHELSLQTPNGNRVTLSDNDAAIQMTDVNENTVTLNRDGIKLESSSDIVLSAQGEIILDATQKIDLDANGDVNVEGLNISLQAATAFKAEGNASAELSASGTTTVKGSIVQIN